MKKLWILLLCCLLCGCASPPTEETTQETILPTETETVERPKKVLTLQVCTESSEYSGDMAQVHQLAVDYLTVKQMDFFLTEHLTFEEFFAPELRETLDEQLSWKVFRFEKLVRRSIQETILWEDHTTGISDVQINGDTAIVSAWELYEYELSGALGSVSSRGVFITIDCIKIDGEWFILRIDTDNELIEGHVDGYTAEELPALAGVLE